jgi:hypothetical protein
MWSMTSNLLNQLLPARIARNPTKADIIRRARQNVERLTPD